MPTELDLLRQLASIGAEMRITQKLGIYYKNSSALQKARDYENRFDSLLKKLPQLTKKAHPIHPRPHR